MKSHVVLNKNKNTAQPGKSESVERSSFNFYAIRPLTILNQNGGKRLEAVF